MTDTTSLPLTDPPRFIVVEGPIGVGKTTLTKKLAHTFGASRWQVVVHVVLPAALPDILVGLRIGMGVGWTTLVAAEMVAASTGIGQMVLNASNFLRTDIVLMGIFVIGVFAALFEFGMRWLERRLVPWKGKV